MRELLEGLVLSLKDAACSETWTGIRSDLIHCLCHTTILQKMVDQEKERDFEPDMGVDTSAASDILIEEVSSNCSSVIIVEEEENKENIHPNTKVIDWS